MGASKLKNYSSYEIRKSNLARALAVPARILILKAIIKYEFVTGDVFLDLLKLSQPTIHHHLSILKNTGLIHGEFIGNTYGWRFSLNNDDELQVVDWFLQQENGESIGKCSFFNE